MKKFSIFLSLLFYSLCLSAQSGTKSDEPSKVNGEASAKTNSLLVSLDYDQVKDENLHPKAFRGPGLGVMFQHSATGINIQEWNAGIHFSALNTKFEDFPSAAAIDVLGRYTYLFSLAQDGQLHYYVGPVVDLRYGAWAFFNWDESHLYYANYLAGGIGSRISYTSGTNTIDFNFDIPLISAISRPVLNRQYKIDNMKPGGVLENLASNPEMALPNKNFYIRTGLELNYLSKKTKPRTVGFGVFYRFMQASEGNSAQGISYSLTYKIIF